MSLPCSCRGRSPRSSQGTCSATGHWSSNTTGPGKRRSTAYRWSFHARAGAASSVTRSICATDDTAKSCGIASWQRVPRTPSFLQPRRPFAVSRGACCPIVRISPSTTTLSRSAWIASSISISPSPSSGRMRCAESSKRGRAAGLSASRSTAMRCRARMRNSGYSLVTGSRSAT